MPKDSMLREHCEPEHVVGKLEAFANGKRQPYATQHAHSIVQIEDLHLARDFIPPVASGSVEANHECNKCARVTCSDLKRSAGLAAAQLFRLGQYGAHHRLCSGQSFDGRLRLRL
eukprot:6493698-Prymnesium_polylepis.1